MRPICVYVIFTFSLFSYGVLADQLGPDQLKMDRQEDAYDGQGEKKLEEEWNFNQDTDELQDPSLEEEKSQKQEEKWQDQQDPFEGET